MRWQSILLITLIILLAVISPGYPDLGKPNIHAVCSIKLKDGKTVEGIILVGTGGYQKYVHTNGFYIIVNENYKIPVLLSIDFRGIEPHKGTIYFSETNVSRFNLSSTPRVYYLQDITPQLFYFDDTTVNETKSTEKDTTSPILARTITHNIRYLMLDYIPLYTEIPREYYLYNEYKKLSPNKPLKIPLINIEKFELLAQPSDKWLKQIAAKEKQWLKDIQEGTDYNPPVWFHNIIKEKEAFKDFFKPWDY